MKNLNEMTKDELASLVERGHGAAREQAIGELARRGRNIYGEKMGKRVRDLGYWNGKKRKGKKRKR